jgi:hypothetical protein
VRHACAPCKLQRCKHSCTHRQTVVPNTVTNLPPRTLPEPQLPKHFTCHKCGECKKLPTRSSCAGASLLGVSVRGGVHVLYVALPAPSHTTKHPSKGPTDTCLLKQHPSTTHTSSRTARAQAKRVCTGYSVGLGATTTDSCKESSASQVQHCSTTASPCSLTAIC